MFVFTIRFPQIAFQSIAIILVSAVNMPLTTSFPSLSFSCEFSIQPPDTSPITLPGLKRPSTLALQLLDSNSSSKTDESKTDPSTMLNDLMIQAAKSTLPTNQTMPIQYSNIKPGTIDSATFDLLNKYLMSGTIKFIDTVQKCMDIIKMCKVYGLCRDSLCFRVMKTLKEMVTVGDVMSVIEGVGDIVTLTAEDTEETTIKFEPRDEFFLEFALDHAHEIFNVWDISRDTVAKTPLIAMLLLSRIPGAYMEKLPKVEEPTEEDE